MRTLTTYSVLQIAQPIRFQLAYLGVDYVDKQYPLTQEGAEEWAQEKEHHGLDFPNVRNQQF